MGLKGKVAPFYNLYTLIKHGTLSNISNIIQIYHILFQDLQPIEVIQFTFPILICMDLYHVVFIHFIYITYLWMHLHSQSSNSFIRMSETFNHLVHIQYQALHCITKSTCLFTFIMLNIQVQHSWTLHYIPKHYNNLSCMYFILTHNA